MANLVQHQNIILKKVATRNDYAGYYLLKYLELEKKSKEELISELKCSDEDFVKLALCKIKPPFESQFASSINKISSYIRIDDFVLSQIIKRVAIDEEQKSVKIFQITYPNLMAAREKANLKDNENNDNS